MSRLLDQVDYDFGSFSMDSFVDWVSQQRHRELELVGHYMPPNLYGAVLQTEKRDYIFYDENVKSVHRLHIQLHEIAHLLCGHPHKVITAELVTILRIMDTNQPRLLGCLRSVHTEEMEQEAEMLAGLIYEQIVRSYRLGRLTCMHSSLPAMANYWHLWERNYGRLG